MYKRILVPLDGAKRSEAILPQVESLAHQFGASIILLEVLEPPPQHAAAVAPDLLKAGVSQRATEIRRYVHEVQERLTARGLTAGAVVTQGPVVDTILTVAKNEKVDLIAMASHGYTGLARFLHGSVAAELLHRARTPLLILHTDEEEA
ncbi:universal stress protein [Caldilinea sp.]|uniref:universal stress protein n=1 Tax=Caldilinea sp. TaxID=2293560 RepID=UPI002B560A03|nr:universal stress protein [Anaerolineales bacterium]HQY91628.1 universal stress protein [Caldilinea sp.]HRA67319.1 universal stress protein [Caldilinea sp.]